MLVETYGQSSLDLGSIPSISIFPKTLKPLKKGASRYFGGRMYIACPKCDWRPDAGSLWRCSCQHVWNTFQTHGVCPACGKAWKVTQCLVCHAYSDHEDWYHDDDDITVEEYLTNPQRILQPVQEPEPTSQTLMFH